MVDWAERPKAVPGKIFKIKKRGLCRGEVYVYDGSE